MITLPSKEDIRTALQAVEQGRMCGERNLPAELEELGGQEFVPQGLALSLLGAAKKALQKSYGEDKSMGSLEGQALVSNIMPKYIKALVSDESLPEVIKLMQEQLVLVV